MMKKARTLRLILGDQLNDQHSWFKEEKEDALYVMMEIRQETDYVRHHIQKVIGFFVSMRNFADQLAGKGLDVYYLRLDDVENQQSLTKNLHRIIESVDPQKFEYQLPDEYRLDRQLKEFCNVLEIETEAFDTEHFLTTREELEEFFKGKKQFLMENFYRYMRKKWDVLMENGEPVQGRWNFDAENRNKLPKNHSLPNPLVFEKDVTEIHSMLEKAGVVMMGEVNPESFIWPTNRQESLQLLDFFLGNCLPDFGSYQDAMTEEDWSLYHSRLSFSLNTKMISPLEVIQKTEAYWYDHQAEITLAQTEGFIRQILGWREYMRGIYWAQMPEYASLNFFEHTRKLPGWFWTGDTQMACLQHSVGQSLKYAYAHHIQRLMITGNFALLAGIDPDEVDQWYLGIYIDAIEWVEITNTRGMSQYADGGLVGSKPYVSSANYIHKMSSYCGNCAYDRREKHGEKACPFNSLYWHFYARNRDKLESNPRVGMMYRTWDKMSDNQKTALLEQADNYLENIEEL